MPPPALKGWSERAGVGRGQHSDELHDVCPPDRVERTASAPLTMASCARRASEPATLILATPASAAARPVTLAAAGTTMTLTERETDAPTARRAPHAGNQGAKRHMTTAAPKDI